MSLVDSLLNVMHMNPDDDDDYYDDDYLDEEEEEERVPKRRASQEKEPTGRSYSGSSGSGNNQPIDINRNRDRSTKTNSKVTPMRQVKKATGMEVCVIKPTSFEDAREITETLLMNRPVILNVEGLDVDIAQRIIDFASGSCFAISGNLQKISNYIFIVTPSDVEISGDIQDILDNYGPSPVRMDF